MRYELFADEAWTHDGAQCGRYWCFYGGIFGPTSCMQALVRRLGSKVAALGLRTELKWTNLSPQNLDHYKEVVDLFLADLESGPAIYRQMFLDRAFPYKPSTSEPRRTKLDAQYMVYYQFLKHHFHLSSLPSADGPHQIDVYLDSHSSAQHQTDLQKFALDLPKTINRKDLQINVRFVESKKHFALQVCDLLMGAAGSYGNRMHSRRQPGVRRMTPKQKCRKTLGKHIYDGLRSLDAKYRGSKAFNWFESTGLSCTTNIPTSEQKIRIWKFIPKNFEEDRGWLKWTRTGEYNHKA